MPQPQSRQRGEQHVCEARRDGDWIIYVCSKCPDYERRHNWRTGEMEARNVHPRINHVGSYSPDVSPPVSGFLH